MDDPVFLVIVIGFIAQMIDGALGMAYGVISTSFLLSLGIPPAAASASVHTAKIFTTLASGISHLGFRNVNRKLVRGLLLPGIIGAVPGAYIVTRLPGQEIKPLIGLYLLFVGALILQRALKNFKVLRVKKLSLIPLAVSGGFFDSIGGGGWGPITTSTIIANGHNPRFTIGSVSFTEFFVTVSQVIVFFLILGLLHWRIVLSLIIDGVIAAPLAAFACKKLPPRILMIFVSIVIISLSIRTIYLSLV